MTYTHPLFTDWQLTGGVSSIHRLLLYSAMTEKVQIFRSSWFGVEERVLQAEETACLFAKESSL